MADLIGIILVAALSYMLGWLRAYSRVIGHQNRAIAAQERAIWVAKKAEELVGPRID